MSDDERDALIGGLLLAGKDTEEIMTTMPVAKEEVWAACADLVDGHTYEAAIVHIGDDGLVYREYWPACTRCQMPQPPVEEP